MTYSSVWRLIPFLDAPGEWQMAIDRWLWEQHRRGNHPPTLRFYTWNPVAISLGYHQKRWPEFWQHLHWHGAPVELVRRPTGGRSVLHQGDLTYMVVVSGISAHRMMAYRQICEFLRRGWRSLGYDLHYGSLGRGYTQMANCFATATAADLVLPSGAKLIGSAQGWHGSTVLQHGSMPIHPDPQLWSKVFSSAGGFPVLSLSHLSLSTLVNILTESACLTFNIELKEEPLCQAEWQEIFSLLEKPGFTPKPGFWRSYLERPCGTQSENYPSAEDMT